MEITDKIDRITDNYEKRSKAAVQKDIETSFPNLEKERSVYVFRDTYALRLAYSKDGKFNNVVLSLSTLKKYDHIPFIVSVITDQKPFHLLANSTFIKKASHSSKNLTPDNIRGSFLGHDIIRDFKGIPNTPNNFEKLFAIHTKIGWEGNIDRIAMETSQISGPGSKKKFDITKIGNSIKKDSSIISKGTFAAISKNLEKLVLKNTNKIIEFAQIDNVNLRGNLIEQIFTSQNKHSLSDLIVSSKEDTFYIDIKTVLANRNSNPKGYNIEKMLDFYESDIGTFAYLFILIDIIENKIVCKLLHPFDSELIKRTRIQHHWSGRNTRGVTQFSNDFKDLLTIDRVTSLNIKDSISFVNLLLKGYQESE